MKIVGDQVGAPTCAFDLAEATTRIVAGIIAGTKSQLTFPEASGTYHMTAAGQTTWYEFANAILDEARIAPRDLPWLASATKGRPLIARRVLPISTQEFHPPTRRPAYSVLSNTRLTQTFGVTLPDWRTQLQKCFSSKHIPANSPSVVSSREKTRTS
jgi:dTDP-4-dehydrorhamnose reductase